MSADSRKCELCDQARSEGKEESDDWEESEKSGEEGEQSDEGEESEKSGEESCRRRLVFENDLKTCNFPLFGGLGFVNLWP